MDVVPGGAVIEFANVSKRYVDEHSRNIVALVDISFSLGNGEFVSIVGPSGCGKSTVLRLAAGLEQTTSGSVLYRGDPVQGPSPERGLVFQAYSAFPWLTVRQNVAFGLRARNGDHAEAVSRWLVWMGLADFADTYPKNLSGGMRQRLAIARAMIVEPQLLLLDEPFGALDERTRDGMQQILLKTIEASKCSALLVTHDIREAILMSDRIILLSKRPARILRVFPCSMPRPRTREQLKSAEFLLLYDSVIESFPV